MSTVTSAITTTRTIVLDESVETRGTLTIAYTGDTVTVTLDNGPTALSIVFTANGFAAFEQKIRTP